MLSRYKGIEIRSFEVWKDTANAEEFRKVAERLDLKQPTVPVTIVDRFAFVGFDPSVQANIEARVREELNARGVTLPEPVTPTHVPAVISNAPAAALFTAPVSTAPIPTALPAPAGETITLPILGEVRTSDFSLPVFTLVIAGLDSFNPCALYVLMFLLSMLIHARSRLRMLIVGGTFVFFSGLVYFLFMTAWLNLFFIAGRVALVTTIAGAVALFVAAVNIKDFFAFKKGVSLTIDDEAQAKLLARMRRLLRADSLAAMLTGTVVLAVAANAYELLCTAGFPMVYTRVLTLNELSSSAYYIYLVFYNLVYIIPLAIVVAAFTFTLGSRKMTEWEGRLLKLLSGAMMLILGMVLLFKPTLLDNALLAAGMLLAAVALTALMAFIVKRLDSQRRD